MRKVVRILVPHFSFFRSIWILSGYALQLLMLVFLFLKSYYVEKTDLLVRNLLLGNLLSIAIIVVVIFLLVSAAMKWYAQSRDLSTFEHTFILSILVLYSSIFFGICKYMVYQNDVHAYAISEDAKDYSITKKRRSFCGPSSVTMKTTRSSNASLPQFNWATACKSISARSFL